MNKNGKTTSAGDHRNRRILREEPVAGEERSSEGTPTNAVVVENGASNSTSGTKSTAGAQSRQHYTVVD